MLCNECYSFDVFFSQLLRNVKTILSLLTIIKTEGRMDLILGHSLRSPGLDFCHVLLCFSLSLDLRKAWSVDGHPLLLCW